MSHILDIQPHHPHYPPTPSPDSHPSPTALNRPGQTGAAMLHYLAGWLVGIVWWRKGCVEGNGGCGGEGAGMFSPQSAN